MKLQSIRRMLSKQSGFTLIELLVVIVIIGILATGAVSVFGGTQAKARDAVRKGDLRTVQNSIELFKANSTDEAAPSGALATDLAPYIQAIPTDPGNLSYQYTRDDEAGTTLDPANFKLWGHSDEDDLDNITFGAGDDPVDALCVDGTAGGCPAVSGEEFGL